MACPMRFVLVGVSLVIAWLAWWRAAAAADDEAAAGEHSTAATTQATAAGCDKRQRQQRRQPSSAAGDGGWQRAGAAAAATFVDMFTGAYLWRALTGGAVTGVGGAAASGGSGAQHIKAC